MTETMARPPDWKVWRGEGDDQDFKAEEDEEDGVLDFVDDAPEAVEGFVGDLQVAVVHVEAAQGESGGDGFKGGGEAEGFGEGVAAEGRVRG